MKKKYLIVLIVFSLVLVGALTYGVVSSQLTSGTGGTPSSGPTPQQQCNANGYVWDPKTQQCTSNVCSAQVDSNTGVITGTMVNYSGDQCVDVQSGAYISPLTRASLLELCQSTACSSCPAGTKFTNLEFTATGPKCTQSTGCSTKPYDSNSIMDGCPYLTYLPGTDNNCVAPTENELQLLCNTSVNGCPLNTNLNANCNTDTPCFNPASGCVAQSELPGCRPHNTMWQWIGTQCVNTTVSNSIAVTVNSATVADITGTFVLDNIPQNASLLWNYVLTQGDKTWQGPVVIKGNTFTASLLVITPPLSVGASYTLVLQVYTSINDSPYVLSFTSAAPTPVTLTAAPVAPGLTTLKPTLSLALAQQVAQDVPGAIDAANANSAGNDPFVKPSADVWSNSLQGYNSGTTPFLIVPCTSLYCKTELSVGVAMLILAWPPMTTLTSDQTAEIKKACSTLSNPQVSSAVYMQETSASGSTLSLVGNKITTGTWLQPLSSDPTKTWLFRVVAYVWSGTDNGVENSQCLSQPLDIPVQVPHNLYSAEVCFNIQPLKPQGQAMEGNFMVYHPGANMCSGPINSVEALGARDFSCLITNTAPSLDNMQLYACNDISYDSSGNCNSSGQGCGPVFPVNSVRQPTTGQSTQCAGLLDGTPPCAGAQYCQEAACNCPPSVDWADCGRTTYAQVGASNAIEEGRWKSRVNNVVNFIQTYGLDKLVNVQTFLNQTGSADSIQKAWDTNYGASVCPLPNWKAPQPGNCDVTSANACTQNTVCGAWEAEPGTPYLYKQEVVQYPTAAQQSSCCPTNTTMYAGCCCPNADSGSSCGDLTGCTPVNGALSYTWCQPSK
jgi:hypothetical protein